jgi:hypothetical protein
VKRVEVPIADYLIEQTTPTMLLDETTQTDAFRPLPAKEPYRQAKTGVDVTTQVDTA